MSADVTLTLFVYAIYVDAEQEVVNEDARRLFRALTGRRPKADLLSPHARPGAGGYRGPNDYTGRILEASPVTLTWHRQGDWNWLIASLECDLSIDHWDLWLSEMANQLLKAVKNSIDASRLAYIDYEEGAQQADVWALRQKQIRDLLPNDVSLGPGVTRGIDQWWLVVKAVDDPEAERWLLAVDTGCLPHALAGRAALLHLGNMLARRSLRATNRRLPASLPTTDTAVIADESSGWLAGAVESAYHWASALRMSPAAWMAEIDAARSLASIALGVARAPFATAIKSSTPESHSYGPNTMTSSAPSTQADSASRADSEQVDIGILIALDEEFQRFRELLPEGYRAHPDEVYGGYDYLFEAGPKGRPYKCVVRLVGDMGPGPAGLATDRLISRWSPRQLVNLGIAAGLHDDLRLGDVVAAEQVDLYAANLKAVPKGKGEWTFEHRGKVYQADHGVLEELKHLPFAHVPRFQAWQHSGTEDIQNTLLKASDKARNILSKGALHRDEPHLHRVHLASGPVVGAARAFTQWLRGRDGTIKALEMEAGGLVEAAGRRVAPVPTLVLRGISDLGDERKAKVDKIGGGAFRSVAMRNATRLLFALLDSELIRRTTGASASAVAPANSRAAPSPIQAIGSTVGGVSVQVTQPLGPGLDPALSRRWKSTLEGSLREAGLCVDNEVAEHVLATWIGEDEMGSQTFHYQLDKRSTQDLPLSSLADTARLVVDAVVQHVVATQIARGELIVVRLVTYPKEHPSHHRTTFRLEAPAITHGQPTSSREQWLVTPLDRIATALSRVSPNSPLLLVPQCTPATAIRAGAVLKRVAGQAVEVIWHDQKWSLEAGSYVHGELDLKLSGRGIEPRELLCLLVSVSVDVAPAFETWANQHGRVALREMHVSPKSGPSQDILKTPEQAVGWARQIGQWLRDNLPSPHTATSIFAATPGPVSVALGMELNALGPVQLLDLDKEHRKYVNAFEFTA